MNQMPNRYVSLTLLFIALVITSFSSCGPKEGSTKKVDQFDRQAMLTFWADDIIIPAYKKYTSKTLLLEKAANNFFDASTPTGLDDLRTAWQEAYMAWQGVSMFDIGEAESLKIRNFTNIYPTNTNTIDENILKGNYNLLLPSNFSAQGFPALDYLLFGIEDDDLSIVNTLSDNRYKQYLLDLATRLNTLAKDVSDDWNTYRDVFIQNNGSSATASVDKLTNDYIFYYEKFLRAGKVGIPAGVFSSNPIPESTEALYNRTIPKDLLVESLNRFYDFFKGISVLDSAAGTSIMTYIDVATQDNDNANLSLEIDDQLKLILQTVSLIDNDLSQQVKTDNTQMLKVYDEMQKLVVLLKVDAMQAMNIQIDYVDADGD